MTRTRIVIDTNVLIFAVLFSGPPRKVLELVIAGVVDCTLSIPILNGLRDVLQRPKFNFSPEQTLHFIEELHNVCSIVKPTRKIKAIKSDPDDNMILECALEAKADFIVSGDSHLLDLGKYKNMKILGPHDFMKLRGSKKNQEVDP